MHILGLDLGTVCGAADGRPGGKPRTWTWNLNDAGDTPEAKFALWQVWLENSLRAYPDRNKLRIYYEQPWTLGQIIAKTQSKKGLQTSDERIDFDRGLVGILKSVAYNAEIRHITPVPVMTARRQFLGKEQYSSICHADSDEQKRVVDVYCKLLGWQCANYNESDACCIWNYGAAKSNPRLAHLSTPLFGSR